jgi:preprotein translocase subunit SecG
MGVRKTADFLEKATWTLAVALLVLSLITNFVIPRNQATSGNQQSEIQEMIDNSQPVDYVAPPEQDAE